jgi:cell division protein FtsW (lipid II flippase)
MKARSWVWFLGGVEVAIAAMYVVPPDLGRKIFVAIVAAAALVVFRLAPRTTVAAAGMGVIVLLATGVLAASSVPGVAQVAEAKDSIMQWRDEQARVAECDARLQSALAAGDLTEVNLAQDGCTRFSQNAWFW